MRETGDRPDVPGVDWSGDVTLTVDGEPVDGSAASFTIGSGTVVEVVGTNTATSAPGGFEIRKLLEGGAADDVPAGTQFEVAYTVDGEPATATVVVGETWTSPDLPAGTEVTVTEVSPPDVDGVIWDDPVLRVDGMPADGRDATFTIGAGTRVEVVVTNTATGAPGNFRVRKAVDGSGADLVPPGTRFGIEYSADGGATWNQMVVTADGTLVGSPDFPAGTEIWLRETVARDDVPGVRWGDVHYTVDGDDASGDVGVVVFTIGPDTTVDVVVINIADEGRDPDPSPSPTPTEPSPTPTEPSPTPTEPTPSPTEPSPTPTSPSPTEPGPEPTEPGPEPTQPSGPPMAITGATGVLLLITTAAVLLLIGGTLIALRRRGLSG